jgi:hypothetical protein
MNQTTTTAACLALGVAVLGAAAFLRRGGRDLDEALRAARAASDAAHESEASTSPSTEGLAPRADFVDLAGLDELLASFRAVRETLALLDQCPSCGRSVAGMPWHAHDLPHARRDTRLTIRRINVAATYREAFRGQQG